MNSGYRIEVMFALIIEPLWDPFRHFLRLFFRLFIGIVVSFMGRVMVIDSGLSSVCFCFVGFASSAVLCFD